MTRLSLDNSLQDPLPPTSRAHLPPIPTTPSFVLDQSQSSSDSALLGAPTRDFVLPPSPTTPLSLSATQHPDGKPKKSNPLIDLIETERTYVDLLAGVIRKVAAAWSKSNLPPEDLDLMFRSIEGVYKANRGLNTKLKEIGTNPSSPKALGDLLMRWAGIDDLETPYSNYCTKYCSGFDEWEPVQSNPKLSQVLTTFSASNPPPPSEPSTWSLDALFLLPKARLKYYKKLYTRLLKSTSEGKSDHRLLIGAVDTLNQLLATVESRFDISAGGASAASFNPPQAEDEVVIGSSMDIPPSQSNSRMNSFGGSTHSEHSSARESASNGTSGMQAVAPRQNRGSTSTLSMPITNLERRLSTKRTLDIFTMASKVVRLQMAPAALTFTREIRLSLDVVIHFTPRATGTEVIHRQGHIFLLSDLFLMCERMSPEDQAQHEAEGADMWLLYPPLSGKVLRISEIEGQDNCLQIAIMKKEFIILEADSRQTRDFMLPEFKDCIEFAASLPPPSKQPPPPMPPLPSFLQSSVSSPLPVSGPSTRVPSLEGPTLPPHRHDSANSIPRYQSPPADGRNIEGFPRVVLSPEAQMHPGAQRAPAFYDMPPVNRGPRLPPHSQSSYPPPQGFDSGQALPPQRTSFGGNGGRPEPNRPGYPPNNYGPGPGPYNQPPFPPPRMQPMSPPRQPYFGLPPGVTSPIGLPTRPPSEPGFQHGVRRMPSTRSSASQYDQLGGPFHPPPPPIPGAHSGLPRTNSLGNLHAPQPRPLLPSAAFNTRSSMSMHEPSFDQPSPPNSPVAETRAHLGPVTSTISAQMKCKVFLQQQHAQWKSLGPAKLKLYRQDPTNIKQLVVESDKDKSVIISTIVLTDGVERVGKTGVAIELSGNGTRTGIIYMLQLRNEKSAGGLFDSLLAGSDRSR